MSDAPLWKLPHGWCWTDVGSIVEDVFAGKSFKCDERPPEDGEVGVVKVSAVTWGTYDERESKTCTRPELVNPQLFVRQGDFLFSRANTIELVGACVIAETVTRAVMLSDKILRFDVRPGWKKWLLWSLRSRHGRAEIERLATGNQDSMRNIGQERALAIRVPMPPSGEQARIVEAIESYFTRLDDAVATLERVKRNLKRYRASVLKAAVEGRLVPTEAALAKQEGRSYEPASVLLERILTKRRCRWSELRTKGKYEEPTPPDTANLPDLPEGWCWATVDMLADLKGGITKGQTRRNEVALREVPYLRVANVQRGYLDLSEVKTIAATDDEIRDLKLEVGDVLFNEGGDRDKLGRGWVWSGELPECIHQNHVFRARILTGDVEPRYLSWYGNGSGQAYFFDQGKQTTNLASINLTKLKGLPVPIPPRQEQVRLVAEVDRLLSVTDDCTVDVERELLRCQRLRQSILKWAFEGKLTDQVASDEPASVLLERIKAERRRSTAVTEVASPRVAKKKQVRA